MQQQQQQQQQQHEHRETEPNTTQPSQPSQPPSTPVAQPQGATEATPVAKREKEEAMEVDDSTRRRSSSNSSSSSNQAEPRSRQMARNLRNVQSELDDLTDDLSNMRLQLLYTMSEQVKQQRRETACQIVIQGFDPTDEVSDVGTAIRNRERWCGDLIIKLAKCAPEMAKFTGSHTVGLDRLSRLSIITLHCRTRPSPEQYCERPRDSAMGMENPKSR